MPWFRQKAGDGSQLVQAGTVNNNYGISVKDAEHICIRLMEERFASYSQQAFQTAKARVEEFTYNYLKALTEKSPQAIENLGDPGVLAAVLEAEEGYAKTGDVNLGEILVEMLVKRTSETSRDTRQLALNEAIGAVQKLTDKHLDALSLIFFLTHVEANAPNLQTFLTVLNSVLEGVSGSFETLTPSDIQYLEATGCAVRVPLSSHSWPGILKKKYPGYFHKGIIENETPAVADIKGRVSDWGRLFVSSLHDPNMIRVNAVTETQARDLAESAGLERDALVNLMTSYPLSDQEIREVVTTAVPALRVVFDRWSEVDCDAFAPSLTGVAIAHANFKKTAGAVFDAEIDVWIK
ncbi:LPO_1073/Vpar_1526 family protein [Streptomyces olivochromogenes]|uniref:LPO_1073/Vpar_1526 family protein n=1 Tax=Streptomyces olivochromogenes TaxID=1963 RepID=UPI001F3CC5D0|nr:LPO_1073/Vpar_1526 family protein [Streptomyces olivochromogenes]MCF3137051.1 hypothetical protein [Streptomyces olivochromogenes]